MKNLIGFECNCSSLQSINATHGHKNSIKHCNFRIRITVIKLLAFFALFLLSSHFNLSHAITKTSTGTGSWNTSGTWSPAGVPGSGDEVIIATGHTVTINTNTSNLLSIWVYGILTIGNNNTDRTVTVSGKIVIVAGGVFNTAGNGGNEVRLAGNLDNSGTFDMRIGSATADVTFNGSANQNIFGTGAVTDFNDIIINNTGSTGNNIVDFYTLNFTAANGFLTLTRGIIKMSGTYTFTNTFSSSAAFTINANSGIWLNNPNVTVTGQNDDTKLYGSLRITDGVYNVGVGADWWLLYYTGATLTLEGGALNVSGAFFGNSTTDQITYIQSGGTLTVCTAGNSYSVGSFEIWATGSSFTMSGGEIVLQRAASSFTDFVNYSTSSVVTGGTIIAGNSSTPAGQVFWLNSTPSIYDLYVDNMNTPTLQLRANTTVLNDVIFGGTLDVASAGVNMTVGHDWINKNTFLQGTNTVTMIGTTPQEIGGSASTSFYNLTINNTGGGVTLSQPVVIGNSTTFTAGIVTSSATYLLSFNDNATTSGANNNVSNPSFVSGPVQKIGNDAFTFPVGKTGGGYHLCAISAPANTTHAFTAEYMRGSGAALGSISSSGLDHVSTCDYWVIDRTTGTSTVNVTLSWNSFSNCSAAAYVNDLSSLVVAHFNGSNWNSHGASSTTGTVANGTITWNSVSSFSPFSLGSNSPSTNPLPVKFSYVKAYPIRSDNSIEWSNQTEEGVIHYEIEKSIDGIHFSTIQSLVAASNNGTLQTYRISDLNVNEVTSFYRVKALEITGIITYSNIVKVDRVATSSVQVAVYPNPVKDRRVTLTLSANQSVDSYKITVVNMAGQIVYQDRWLQAALSNSKTVQLPSSIVEGAYMLNVSNEQGIQLTRKIIVQ